MTDQLLFIAPAENIAKLAAKIKQVITVDMTIKIGIEQAKEIALSYPEAAVIISRGGAAESLKGLKERSVIEIKVTTGDIFHALQNIAKHSYVRKVGIVSRMNLFDDLQADFEMFNTKIFFRPCKNDEEIQTTVQNLCQNGIEAIIGCQIAIGAAKKFGVPTEFLESGEFSIEKAIREAVLILRAREIERFKAAQLRTIIDNIEEGIIAISNDNQVTICNQSALNLFKGDANNINEEYVKSLLQNRNNDKVMEINGNKVMVKATPLLDKDMCRGNVVTIREVNNIQDIERKIRMFSHQKGLYAKRTFANIITTSEQMTDVIQKARKYAGLSSTILIQGETGVGKDVFAQSVHNASQRRNGPFVSVNCAAIPHNLMESELFGYATGAFTGARKEGKKGLFEISHGGTIFLDEIGELPMEIQSLLLRVLQEKEIMRIGDDKIIPVDVRVICATNRNLLDMAERGAFRYDLYYRVHVLVLTIPPLRDRTEDIPLLLMHYIDKIKDTRKHIQFSHKAINRLRNHSWRGNVRELMNVAEVLAVSDYKLIDEQQVNEILGIGEYNKNTDNYLKIPSRVTLKEMEACILDQLLSRSNPTQVCAMLGISRVTLWRKMKKLFQ
jgi:transcriptional regulator with PAS, ATPase and Fis domain